MFDKSNLIKINDYLWEIPKSYRKDMRVPARIYASEKMVEEIFRDRSLEQLVNLCCLDGIEKYGLVMPDCHEGYASPIGGVAAIRVPDGIISPGMAGYDLNCGMKLLKSQYSEKEIRPYLDKLAVEIQKEVPSGLGRGRQTKLSVEQIDRILEGGAQYLIEKGYGEEEDAINCEAAGKLDWADNKAVSQTAKNRGRDQVGTLGSGNHFTEVQKVEEIFDEKVAEIFGLFKDQVVVMIHTGSRGLGHQVATDYIREFMGLMGKYKIKVPDREFACVPFNSSDGQRYFSAMAAAANFAWANRQMIACLVRKVWKNILREKGSNLSALYDVAHNIIKKEKYIVNGEETELAIHRKGATRAFPGQPVLIPGSMGTASYVLVGTKKGEEAFFSTCHGAGRTMSRHEAMRKMSGEEVMRQLESKGIIVKCKSFRGLAEEAPQAYKNIDEVVEVVENAGLSKKVAKLVPIAVIKGE